MTVLSSTPSTLSVPRLRPMERLGRSLVARALSRVRLGSVELNGPWGFGPVFGDRGGPRFEVEVLDPAFYSAAAMGGSTGLAESYMAGHWRCPDLPGLIELMARNIPAANAVGSIITTVVEPVRRAAYWLERNTRAGARRNIHRHYDLGNDFFRLFLDPSMTYSSAFYATGAESLQDAQEEKIDRACRRLELRPGDHLIEIGSGWGALAIHAASRYGCRVTTTTISNAQFDLASERVARAGLSDRIAIIREDYRDLPRRGHFDKLVSIEMIEAVGASYLGDYFETCCRLLRPGGRMLLQAIVIRDQLYEAARRRRDFLKQYIFPGSCLPSLHAMTAAMRTRTDLRVESMEEFGPDYARTLAEWRSNFHARLDAVRSMGFDERFIRMWDYYFAYCEGVFRSARTGVVQMLMARPDDRMSSPAASVSPGAVR